MTNQRILEEIENSITVRHLPIDLREKILDAIWQVLTDNRTDPKDEE